MSIVEARKLGIFKVTLHKFNLHFSPQYGMMII